MTSGITILDWKPIPRNTLCGFASAKIERIDDVAVHQKDAARWASLLSKPMLHAAGSVLRESIAGFAISRCCSAIGKRPTASAPRSSRVCSPTTPTRSTPRRCHDDA